MAAARLEAARLGSGEDVASGLVVCSFGGYRERMADPLEKLTPADPGDLASALAFALLFQGRKRVRDADELISAIVAKRLERRGARMAAGARPDARRQPPFNSPLLAAQYSRVYADAASRRRSSPRPLTTTPRRK